MDTMVRSTLEVERTKQTKSSWLVKCKGQLDVSTSAQFEAALRFDNPVRLVTVDLSEVSFMDSSGIRSLMIAFEEVKKNKGELVVHGMSAAVARVLGITGLGDMLDAE